MRWSSSDNGEGGEGGEGKQKGFLERFVGNVRRGLERDKEMQESLKGLQEERQRMQQSYVLQRWKEQAGEGWEKMRDGGRRGWEVVIGAWGKTKETVSKVTE